MKTCLWQSEKIQKDLIILQNKYKELGYILTLEQVYDSWTLYCNYCSANWIYVDGDISTSEWAVKKVLGIESQHANHLNCVVAKTCINGIFYNSKPSCKEDCDNCNCHEFVNYYPTAKE